MKKIKRKLKFTTSAIDNYFTANNIGHGFLCPSVNLLFRINKNLVVDKISSNEEIGEYEKHEII